MPKAHCFIANNLPVGGNRTVIARITCTLGHGIPFINRWDSGCLVYLPRAHVGLRYAFATMTGARVLVVLHSGLAFILLIINSSYGRLTKNRVS